MINPIQADSLISGILESPNESKSVELKPSFSWPGKIDGIQKNNKAQEVIKSILAMSNTRDGGKILLGIEKDKNTDRYVLKGMEESDLSTYDQDLIYNQVRNFGEPEPRFEVKNVIYSNMKFIVIAVQGFQLSPVISRNNKNLAQIEQAVLYIRTDKPETKRITDPAEMRDIIDLALEKELTTFSTRVQQYLHHISIQPPAAAPCETDADKFNDELKDII